MWLGADGGVTIATVMPAPMRDDIYAQRQRLFPMMINILASLTLAMERRPLLDREGGNF